MKVLQVNSVCGVGSTGRIATDIHQLLVEQDYESYIAYGRGSAENWPTALRIGTNRDNYEHLVLTRLFDRHGFGSKKATEKFIEQVKTLNPDIIQLHNIHGYYLNIERWFSFLKQVNKPVVWTLHDCWSFTGHCSYFDYVHCDKWKTGCKNCPAKTFYPASKLIDNSEDNYQRKKAIFSGLEKLTLVTPSLWLKDLVKDSFLKQYPVQVINNGINLEVFHPVTSNYRTAHKLTNKFVILGVANLWDYRKGLKYFIELAERIDKDEVIVLVGLTEAQIKQLPPNIIGIPKTNNIQELAEIYSTADVFVNPTLEDNFPTTNLEALACGTPVITFATGGSGEAVNHKTGMIVRKGNFEQLNKSIQAIKCGTRVFLERDMVERASKMFDKNQKYLEYLQLYQKSVWED